MLLGVYQSFLSYIEIAKVLWYYESFVKTPDLLLCWNDTIEQQQWLISSHQMLTNNDRNSFCLYILTSKVFSDNSSAETKT